ncbi:MAG: SDR family NAD(P)-dependent oxidoreductase [Chloroflexi bacterium]|nr:SDR family NAD(P)-dependent oxidoreductase [Chloroflexota bacterium]
MAADFAEKVVLITGAARGSGRKLAEAFAAQGARVAANDITPIHLDGVVEQINANGGQARAYVEDIAKKMPVQTLVNQVLDDFGRIDILVNHAAVEPHKPLLDMDDWDWQRALTVNLTGAFLVTQSVGRVMRQQGGGVVVNIAPLAGGDASPGRAAYVASMTGLLGLTRQAARELAAHNIRVHAVCTGMPELHHAEGPCPADMVAAALYLCSPAAAHLNGQIINVTTETP